MIQENEEHKCKRFMAGLNVRIKVYLAWASQINFRELVEATLKVERTVSVLTQGRFLSFSLTFSLAKHPLRRQLRGWLAKPLLSLKSRAIKLGF